eukprot:1162010-Pelagomonas_calceolata.AAC.10
MWTELCHAFALNFIFAGLRSGMVKPPVGLWKAEGHYSSHRRLSSGRADCNTQVPALAYKTEVSPQERYGFFSIDLGVFRAGVSLFDTVESRGQKHLDSLPIMPAVNSILL